MSIDRTLQLRAQEIIMASSSPIAARDALKMALLERYTSLEELADAAASFSVSALNKLAKATYNLPDDQSSLFDIPGVISVRTSQGPLLIPKEQATVGQVGQWLKEGLQHHSTQRLRFKRANKDHKALNAPETDIFIEVRRSVAQGNDSELEGGDE